MEHALQALINWLENSPWPCPAIATLIFLESSPFLGLFIPGFVLIPALGTISGSHLMDYWTLFSCAALGAVLVDLFGYWLGRMGYTHWQHRISRGRTEGLQQRTNLLFERHGLPAIFIGRILFVIHPMVPMTAGALGIRLWKFLPIDLLAILVWLNIYLGGGHWLTVGWRHFFLNQGG